MPNSPKANCSVLPTLKNNCVLENTTNVDEILRPDAFYPGIHCLHKSTNSCACIRRRYMYLKCQLSHRLWPEPFDTNLLSVYGQRKRRLVEL